MLAIGLLLGGCASGEDPPAAIPTTGPAGFPVGAPFDYQLGAAYPPPPGVRAVVRDSTAAPAPGLFSVCYVNGFQTQPADRQLWLEQRADLVVRRPDGSPVIDPGWPDELILDTSTADRRDRLAALLVPTMDRCADAGFAAVEFDNLDAAQRSDGVLTDDDNLALAATYTRLAHDRRLLAGQKNAADLGGRARAVGFDFAVTEECVAFAECDAYRAVYGDATLDVEYTGEPCRDPSRPRSTVRRDRLLVGPDDPGYAFELCP